MLSVVLAGDIFDRDRIEGPTLRAFAEFVDALYECKIPVYFIQGNHDLDRDDPLPGIEGAIHIHQKLIPGPIRLYGLDWMPKENLKEALLGVPECDVLVLHAKMQHLCGYGMAADISMDDIPSHVGNVVVGDIHIMNNTALHGTGSCISPGGLHPCTLAEDGDKGFFLFDGKTWTPQEIPHRKIHHIRLLNNQDMELLPSLLNSIVFNVPEGLEPLIEIRYATEYSGSVEEIEKALQGKAFLFPKPSATGKMLLSSDLEAARKSFREITLTGALNTIVDPAKEPDVFRFVDELLQVPDGTAVVDRIMEDICARCRCS